MIDINEALIFATRKHSKQKRKNGTPYIWHPIGVALMLKEAGFDEKYQTVGLFHDLLEDTDATEEEILFYGDESVLEAVILLTKEEGYIEEDYFGRILKNPIAKAVKNMDRIYNLRDSVNAGAEFVDKYLKETEKWFLGKFSPELDEEYYRIRKIQKSFE